MAKPIKIDIVGDSKGFTRAVDTATKDMSRLTSGAVNAGKNIARGLAIGVGAATAVGVSAVNSAIGFEKQMNEVFTLMPGITEGAMSDMTSQVQDFSKEFGVLPDEVVPALYSALSAGVPADTVFDYMETATKLATGGVTDLDTAVDGLSSVVNAYGSDIITSAEASDIMFTAVRFGKTTVDEIATSISNVTPIASALGVGFDEVGASLAVLTAQGVPTAQATTQLRGAMSELAKEGSIADTAFRDLTGISFTQFIEDGGDLTEGLLIMSEGAEAAGGSVIDMFGSVEAGSAVLGLTRDDASAMTDVMAEMDESAGATDEAFETMASGMAFQFDQIKATIKVFMIQLGEKLMPVVQKVVDFVTDKLIPAFSDFAAMVKEDVIPVIKDLWKKYLEPLYKKVFAKLKEAWDKVTDSGKDMTPVLAALGAVAALAAVAFAAWAVSMLAAAAPILAIVAAVALLAGGFVWLYKNVEGFRNAIDGMVTFFKSTVLPGVKGFATQMVGIFSSAFGAVKAVVGTVLKIIKKLWDGWGKDAITMLKGVWKSIKDIFDGGMKVLTGIFDLIKAILTGKWGEAWEAVKKIMDGAIQQIMGVLRGMWSLVKGALTLVRTAIAAVFTTAWNAAKTAVSDGWDKVAEFFSGIPDKLKSYGFKFLLAGKELGQKIINGLGAGLSKVAEFASNIASAIKGAVITSINSVIGLMNRAIPDKLGWGPLAIDIPDNPIPTISRAMGGPASGSVLVGERGPEVVNLPRGSNVVANHEAGGMGGGITVNVQSNADPHQIASEVAWAIRMGGR